MSFDRPLMLVALLAVPLLAALWFVLDRRRREEAADFTAPALLPNLIGERPAVRRIVPFALLLVGIAVLTVAAARPHAKVTVPRKEATILLGIDVSRSMTAQDVAPSRAAAAKRAADTFLDEVPAAYKIGIVGIGSRAFVAIPPTIDRALAHDALTSLTQSEGTALGDAITLGVRIAKRQRTSDGFVPPTSMLVISDGARDGGRTAVAAAARRARAAHVPVSTVLVGTPNGIVTVPLQGGYSEQIRVPANVGALQMIARSTGGRFYRARSAARLQDVYKELATRVGHTTKDRQIADAFAGGGIILLLASGALSLVWFRRVL
jgi:Ca-activated chloride channel family protein